jgi:hypothetical protein
MSSALPSESAASSAVDTFGLGTYDSEPDSDSHGKSQNEKFVKKTLPDGGPKEVQSPDRFLSYPEMEGSVSSSLPSDSKNPSAHSDYYDDTIVGQDLWPTEDAGVYAQKTVSEPSLPGVSKNEVTMDDFMGALTGYLVTEDVSGPGLGFPTPQDEYPEHGIDGGSLVSFDVKDKRMSKMENSLKAFGRDEITIGEFFDSVSKTSRKYSGKTAGAVIDGINTGTIRKATNLTLVGDLTEDFLKEFGKKNLTKRHVLAFLQAGNLPQYLSSDVIRCLKHRHQVYVKDVLDEFPVAKIASGSTSSDKSDGIFRPEISRVICRVAASISTAIAVANKLEGRNG